ncbi:hypothetical protein GLOIN_2v1704246 [Rhizophagus irregularis DAOM 181602=DAOM 197198]|uniref:Uncharacterized protein n=1 Tax=Rhizophagus irregularis (strain DAOM 181602 / DAOM 197198 / MUCL 43194) TaxID=747089 RepID=A0A2P4P7N0_RHIID|nr:hypothetical protein GLOIN_2v1704246 [Rhizophagus irregularis DAOM 181602=DAOM 197198]POG61396.1 hypothetical protein GLOIN_2v1704246 [Rhizophagus irregularis DAOM 181602=DAOM 197198]|eukprot:XP_025168262.1 hypothetical protein GLOIN_2v1704246 [Rhizophagus irregularis DAOM 181602=DAOM 197198]
MGEGFQKKILIVILRGGYFFAVILFFYNKQSKWGNEMGLIDNTSKAYIYLIVNFDFDLRTWT